MSIEHVRLPVFRQVPENVSVPPLNVVMMASPPLRKSTRTLVTLDSLDRVWYPKDPVPSLVEVSDDSWALAMDEPTASTSIETIVDLIFILIIVSPKHRLYSKIFDAQVIQPVHSQ